MQTPNPKKIDIICKKNKFDYPIFYASKNNINKINNFPEQIEYQTFLLNQDNRVLIIGNPIKNEKLWNLYLRTINNSAK